MLWSQRRRAGKESGTGGRNRRARRPSHDRLEPRSLLSTFTVNTTRDENNANMVAGDLSLREAIIQANANPGPDTIILPAGNYKLTIPGANEAAGQTGDLDIASDLAIVGAGPASTIVDGNQLDRVFQVVGAYNAQPTVTLQGITIKGGKSPATVGYTGDGALSNDGGGVEATNANLSILDCVVQGNATGASTYNKNNQGGFGGYGGGVDSQYGTLSILNSVVTGNVTGTGTTMGGDGGGVSESSSTVTITNSTITNNTTGASLSSVSLPGRGGGIYGSSGSLAITASTVGGNRSGDASQEGEGGGIYAGSTTLTLSTSTVTANTSFIGGGLASGGTGSQILDSTISNNMALGFDGGGGIFVNSGTIGLISGTTISGNAAPNASGPFGGGGGISMTSIGTITSLLNSTISGNSTNDTGGGITSSGTITRIASTTIANNTASDGGGLILAYYTNFTPVIGTLTDTIIAGNTASGANPKDFHQLGQVNSATYDLIQDPNGHTLANGVNGNVIGLAPKLGALASNGGPSQTQALLPGSPALDAGSNANAPSTDQRGRPRPANGVADIGAFELQADPPPVAVNDSYAVAENGTLVVGGAVPTSTPLLRYGFDEAASGASTALDTGATPAANGIFSGSATRTASTPAGASIGALDLSAPGDNHVAAPDALAKIGGLGALTATAWVNLRAAPSNGDVLLSDMPATNPAGDGGWDLRIVKPFDNGNPLSAGNFGLQFSVAQSFGTYTNAQGATSTATSADAQWVFVAITFDPNNTLTFYRGDTSQAVSQLGGQSIFAYKLLGNSAPFEIGATAAEPGVDRTPPAWLDDVRVYGAALTPAQLDRVRQEDLGLGVLANDGDPNRDPITPALVSGPMHGMLTFNGDGSFAYKPAANFAGFDQFTYNLSDGDAVSNVATVDINVPSTAADLTVVAISPTSTGFSAQFNRPINPALLNLYDTASAGFGPADVTLVGATTGPVTGSLVLAPGNQAITFVKTGGVLAPDTYTLTFRSASNGFVDTSGGLLDGNGDGIPGDNYTASFVVTPSSARVVAVPDFARGPGQPVNVPATGAGLPLTISDGTGVTSISLSLTYNPALLSITGANLGSAAPPGSSVTIDTSTPGLALLTFTSPTALPAGPANFASLVASVPASAPYASKEDLVIANILLDGGSIAATDQDGVHVVAYLGDTTGNGGYSSLDATLLRQVLANISTGFAAFPLLDPTILGDVAGFGTLSGIDATYITQYVANIPQPRIPALPGVAITQGGPDPLIWLPQDLDATPGSTLTVPVDFRQTNGTAITLDAASLALEFDPSVFIVTRVRLGNVLRGFALSEAFDNATGAIIAWARSASGPIELAPGTEGTLLLIDLEVRPGAGPGPSRINLLGEGRVGHLVMSTSMNDGGLTLTPAPTDSDLDPVDGVVTISGPPEPGPATPRPVSVLLTVPAGPLAAVNRTLVGSASSARRKPSPTVFDGPAPVDLMPLIPIPDSDPWAAFPSPTGSPSGTARKKYVDGKSPVTRAWPLGN